MVWVVVGLFLVFLIWASLSQIDQHVRATGRVVPSGNARTVQHLEGGIVEEILVREGQSVKAGETLFLVANTMAFIDTGIAKHGASVNAVMTAPKTRSNIDSVARKVAIARLLNTRNGLLETALKRESILLEVKPPAALDGDPNWAMIQLTKR